MASCWSWIVALGAVVLFVRLSGAFYLARRVDARHEERAALVARADQQHKWVLAGDDRGVYGLYTPLDLIAEAAQMPDAAIEFVRRNVGYVRTPDHLIPLRGEVREHHRSKLNAVFGALHQRINQPNAPWFPAFQAAAEMAVMAEVGGAGLPPGDRQTLRKLWENLLRAR